MQTAVPCPPHTLAFVCCIRVWSVYYLLLCSLLLLQSKFPHRGNKAELNYTELNWNRRHSTPGSLATASWCKARAGRKCAHNQTHSDKKVHSNTHFTTLSFICAIIICKTQNLTSLSPVSPFQPPLFADTFCRSARDRGREHMCVRHVCTSMLVFERLRVPEWKRRKGSAACLFAFKLNAGVRASPARSVISVERMKPAAELISWWIFHVALQNICVG